MIDHEADLAKLSSTELNAEIDRCKVRLALAPNTRLRKSFESRIHWLEGFRKRHFQTED